MPKYVNRMKEKMRERTEARQAERRGGGTTLRLPDESSDVEFYKVDSTRAELDIVPYVVSVKDRPDGVEKGELWYTRRYFVHRGVGAEENSYICPKATFGKKCPICEYASAQRKRGADKEVLKELKPKARDLFNVVDLEDGGKLKVWDVSAFLFGDQLDRELKESDDGDNDGFADLEDGRTLKLRFEKKSFNKNDFYAIDRIDFKPRKAYKEKILDEVVDLDKMLVCLPYEELERIFYMDEAPVRDEDEEEPKSRRAAPVEDDEEEEAPRSRRSKKVEEDEDEEETPKPRSRKHSVDEDEEDEEERPSRRGRSRKQEDDEDDEPRSPKHGSEDTDEDEDEEETPKPRKRSRRPEPEEDEDEEETPKRSRRTKDEDEEEDEPRPRSRRNRESKSKDEDCPGGGVFGKDNDKFDECDTCKKWGECNRAQQG